MGQITFKFELSMPNEVVLGYEIVPFSAEFNAVATTIILGHSRVTKSPKTTREVLNSLCFCGVAGGHWDPCVEASAYFIMLPHIWRPLT